MTEIWFGLTLVDLAVVGGVAVVLPAVLPMPRIVGLAVALGVVLSCHAERGSIPAAGLALLWVLAVLGVVRRVLRATGPLGSWREREVVEVVMSTYALVAASWFALSRLGVEPMGIREPIVELTAVHFTYVGVGAMALAGEALARQRGRLSLFAVVGTAAAPVLVAVGFVTGRATAQVGGAVLLTLAVWATATVELRRAWRRSTPGATRLLLGISGSAVWAPMLLAVGWAAGQHWAIPALSVPDMVRTHGTMNALGFVGAGLLARALDHRRETASIEDRRSSVNHCTAEAPWR